MNDDLAFCLQTFVKEQRIALESTRSEQEKTFYETINEKKKIEDNRHQLQDQLIVLAQRIFSWLQAAVNITYDKIKNEINNIAFISKQSFGPEHTNRLVMLLVTIHLNVNSFEESQWPPSYFIPILHESIESHNCFVKPLDKNLNEREKEDDWNIECKKKIDYIIELISQNQIIRAANRRYCDEIRTQKRKVDNQRHPSQGGQSETLTTIFELLSKTIDNGYQYSERYIRSSIWNSDQEFWKDILYQEFLESIRSHEEFKRKQSRKIDRQLKRRHRADQTRVRRDLLQLATTLRILAIGSSQNHQDTFEKGFLNEQKIDRDRRRSDNADREAIAPVIFGRIDEPSTKPLPITVTLDEDYESWNERKSGTRKKATYIEQICKQLNIPQDAFRIERIEAGSTIVYGIVRPPYGKIVMKYFSVDDAELDHLSQHNLITTITLGRFGLNVRDQVLFSQWNRVYGSESGGTYWQGSLDRAGKPYYCPVGWTRFAIKVTETQEEFDRLYSDYHVAYHGTKHAVASDILNQGLLGNAGGCYREGLSIYLSPSIEYSAHPRYAAPWHRAETGKYYQMVLQCRVNPEIVKNGLIEAETLLAKTAKHIQIDANFSNDELEWILPADEPVSRHDLVCYGLMVRITSTDPAKLPGSQWWKHVWKDEK